MIKIKQRLKIALNVLDRERQSRLLIIKENQKLKEENAHLESLLAQIGYRGKDA